LHLRRSAIIRADIIAESGVRGNAVPVLPLAA